ncbi:uncharacterized protein [Palaemon carinicauda]|uniref:uncharacterized protein n=1 Tax=Palaemon carinicauda TaxID=392227 RepID=UPI0035B6A509
MKTSLIFLLLVGVLLPVFSEENEVKKRQNDVNEEEEEEEDEEEEWDVENEVFGPQVQRFRGIHILNENHDVIISEPSERVLRAIAGNNKEDELTLEKVKMLYREKIKRDERKESERRNGELFNQNFGKLLAEEQKATGESAAKDNNESILKRVMNFFWK